MIEINLIPDVKLELIKAERARTGVISIAFLAGVISLGVVVLLALYVYGIQGARGLVADAAIDTEYKKLSAIEDLSKTLTIQHQLETITSLNDEKRMDARVYDLLDAIVPPAPNEVQVANLIQDNENGSITISGQTGSYDSVEAFKKTIDGAVITFNGEDNTEQTVKLASNISVASVGFGEGANGQSVVTFDMVFSYAPEMFSAKIPTVTVKLTNAGNVTDSFLGVPRSIFVNTGGAQ